MVTETLGDIISSFLLLFVRTRGNSTLAQAYQYYLVQRFGINTIGWIPCSFLLRRIVLRGLVLKGGESEVGACIRLFSMPHVYNVFPPLLPTSSVNITLSVIVVISIQSIIAVQLDSFVIRVLVEGAWCRIEACRGRFFARYI